MTGWFDRDFTLDTYIQCEHRIENLYLSHRHTNFPNVAASSTDISAPGVFDLTEP